MTLAEAKLIIKNRRLPMTQAEILEYKKALGIVSNFTRVLG